ncbi:TetR/AcrR family transcriptional regulator [Mycobacterium sp. MYCO198283]|uniref:TetR/AcrR family transcriptional regulator n=1 Tax=Mycobacterium sp. MYCO198283 TaxID=2883505 RepID=UPI001E296D1C|nr:TetR/AcrR family transcriptional regulator [Mycobacterium sp. MYCO198283]MCG5431132.1 TetR/AcrR family transcriptional regulator [Mycobacterium sp. MYCO198283]
MTSALSARSSRKRDAILAAGRDLFLAQGYRGTSVEAIAASAHVSKQTVYKHFADKQQLLSAIVTPVLADAGAAVRTQVTALADTDDVRSELVTLASGYLRSVLSEPVVQLRRLVIGEAGTVPDLADTYYEQAPAATMRAFADAFAALDHRGVLRVPDPPRAAEHFAFLVVGSSIDRALFYGGSATLARLDVDDHARSAVEVFLAAYLPRR